MAHSRLPPHVPAVPVVPQVKQTAVRMMTTFSVQASVSAFQPIKRLLKEAPHKILPKAVVQDNVDILAVHVSGAVVRW